MYRERTMTLDHYSDASHINSWEASLRNCRDWMLREFRLGIGNQPQDLTSTERSVRKICAPYSALRSIDNRPWLICYV